MSKKSFNIKEVKIRPVRADDYKDIHEIMSNPEVALDLGTLPWVKEDEIKNNIEKSKSTERIHLVAEYGGKVIGFASSYYDQDFSRFLTADVAVAVHRDYQNSGVGSCLMEKLIQYIKDFTAILRLELGVFADNENAIKLYKKFGFRQYGRDKMVGLYKGKMEDHIFMSLHIDRKL